MLHVIAAMLSLLLLAGMFGNDLDSTDEESTEPASARRTNDEMTQAAKSTR